MFKMFLTPIEYYLNLKLLIRQSESRSLYSGLSKEELKVPTHTHTYVYRHMCVYIINTDRTYVIPRYIR